MPWSSLHRHPVPPAVPEDSSLPSPHKEPDYRQPHLALATFSPTHRHAAGTVDDETPPYPDGAVSPSTPLNHRSTTCGAARESPPGSMSLYRRSARDRSPPQHWSRTPLYSSVRTTRSHHPSDGSQPAPIAPTPIGRPAAAGCPCACPPRQQAPPLIGACPDPCPSHLPTSFPSFSLPSPFTSSFSFFLLPLYSAVQKT